MTIDEFRALALGFPETEESSHMDHPDFRVAGKIFATIAPDGKRGMAKLTPDQQETIMRISPAIFEPASGAWGRKGSTMIDLDKAGDDDVRHALNAAWRNTAPQTLLDKHDGKN